MNESCRLCGRPERSGITLTQEGRDGIYFRDVVAELIKPTILITDESYLSQNVCTLCKDFVQHYFEFIERVTSYQQKLAHIKQEKIASRCVNLFDTSVINLDDTVVEQELTTITQSEIPEIEQQLLDQLEDPSKLKNGDNEYQERREEIESIASSDASSHLNLRKKLPPKIEPCSVLLERIHIVYVDSEGDTESDTDDEYENDQTLNKKSPRKTMKRSLDASFDGMIPSPSKRMRVFSPQKSKSETLFPKHQSTMLPHPNNFKKYFALFKEEFDFERYDQSLHNYDVPATARESDGSIIERLAKSFTPWSSIQTKCPHKACTNDYDYKSPYQMLTHYKKDHPQDAQSKKFMLCPLCTVGKLDFLDFHNHMKREHLKHLGYCCIVCSKMFFNFKALYQHYKTSHKALKFQTDCMCLHDGTLFPDFQSLELHVTTHKQTEARPSPKTDTIVFQENASPIDVANCNTCLDLVLPDATSNKYQLDTNLNIANK